MAVMKYWGYFAAKLAGILGVVCALSLMIGRFFPQAAHTRFGKAPPLFLHNMAYTFAVWGVWLVTAGLLSAAIRDQRRRCRTCLRPLIMPVSTGSWGNILRIGRPTTEWICSYGHGTLRIDELNISGKEPPDWQPHGDDILKELESSYQARR